jgi:galactonate dehydratase
VDEHVSRETVEALERLLAAFEQGTEGRAEPILDLNFNAKPESVLRVAGALARFGLAWLEVDCYEADVLGRVRARSPLPICSGENLHGARAFRPFLERGALDVASVDVIWNGFAQAKKIADLADTYEVTCTPHNYYSHLATFISAQWCAAIPNVRLLEVDVDDVPWKDELTTAAPELLGGELRVPLGPGWGADVNEDVLAAHPWPHG